jgi:vacuolar-type H+-ATPase subunit I/STV1
VSVARLDTLIWTLIYGGLVVLVVGFALRGSAPGIGAVAIALGSVLAFAGVVLIVVRSRTIGRKS